MGPAAYQQLGFYVGKGDEARRPALAPTCGAELRYVSVHEAAGEIQVVLPYFRARKIAVMTVPAK